MKEKRPAINPMRMNQLIINVRFTEFITDPKGPGLKYQTGNAEAHNKDREKDADSIYAKSRTSPRHTGKNHLLKVFSFKTDLLWRR